MKFTESPTDNEFLVQYAEAQIDEHREEIEAFKAFSASKGLPLTNDSFSYTRTIGVVASAPSILDRLAGGIARERDGIISFQMLSSTFHANAHQPGYFRGNNFMLMAHPYFLDATKNDFRFLLRMGNGATSS